jgi:hypothetical protein
MKYQMTMKLTQTTHTPKVAQNGCCTKSLVKGVLMKTKITCGCGFYTADTLEEYDFHLLEHVNEDDGNLKLYIDRTYTTTVLEEWEIEQQNEELFKQHPELAIKHSTNLARELYQTYVQGQ